MSAEVAERQQRKGGSENENGSEREFSLVFIVLGGGGGCCGVTDYLAGGGERGKQEGRATPFSGEGEGRVGVRRRPIFFCFVSFVRREGGHDIRLHSFCGFSSSVGMRCATPLKKSKHNIGQNLRSPQQVMIYIYQAG